MRGVGRTDRVLKSGKQQKVGLSMMNDRRVVITGCGAISCVGNSVPELWDAVSAGRCGIGPVTRFDSTGFRTQLAGEVKNFDSARYMTPKEAKRLGNP